MTKKLPLPIVGLILSLFGLGNLWQDVNPTFRLVLGSLGSIIGILFIIRIMSDFKTFSKEMNNPVLTSVFGTFSMAIMLFATYVKPLIGSGAIYIWYLGILLHLILITYFSKKFILNFDIEKVFASYYIVYVGIVVISLTSPIFAKRNLGMIAFYFGLLTSFILLALVNYRYFKYKNLPDHLKPIFIITAAPLSLCLSGYLQAFQSPSKTMVIFLLILSQGLFLVSLYKFISYIKLPFYPSFSAFTFPFVISAIALKMACGFLAKIGLSLTLLSVLQKFEFYLASLVCLYVLYKYIINFFKVDKEI